MSRPGARKSRNQRIENRFDLLALGEIRIPFLFRPKEPVGLMRKMLSGFPVFNGFSPDLFDLEAGICDCLL
jgi:hypothetical protein